MEKINGIQMEKAVSLDDARAGFPWRMGGYGDVVAALLEHQRRSGITPDTMRERLQAEFKRRKG